MLKVVRDLEFITFAKLFVELVGSIRYVAISHRRHLLGVKTEDSAVPEEGMSDEFWSCQ